MKQLAENVLDIAENSVRAEAKHIKILLHENTDAKTLRITIEDDGCGMSDEVARSVMDPFYTTRTTRKVGLGVPFFKMEAEMTGGNLELVSKIGEGTKISALFHTSHLDCIPLGDMSQTVMALIGGSPDTEFYFSHTFEPQKDVEIVVDTMQLREMLGEGVPLDTPEILLWIRDYVTEMYAAV
jgi:Signal transduction histidine kinase